MCAKCLGAPVSAILILFIPGVHVAYQASQFAIAVPLAWYFMHNWLQQYAYHVKLGLGFFATTIIGSIMVIAWATVGYTAIKAAFVNPAKSLRNE